MEPLTLILHTEATCKFFPVILITLRVFSISQALAAGSRCSALDHELSHDSAS